MANDMNQCNFTGRLGKDPEVRQLPNGTVASFTLGVGKQWRDKQSGEKKEQTAWPTMIAYGALAEVIEKYATKGQLVRVTAEFRTRKYEQDGQTRYAQEFIISDFQMLGGQPGQQQGGGQQQQQQQRPQQQSRPQSQPQQRPQQQQNFDDDAPF